MSDLSATIAALCITLVLIAAMAIASGNNDYSGGVLRDEIWQGK